MLDLESVGKPLAGGMSHSRTAERSLYEPPLQFWPHRSGPTSACAMPGQKNAKARTAGSLEISRFVLHLSDICNGIVINPYNRNPSRQQNYALHLKHKNDRVNKAPPIVPHITFITFI